MNILLNGLGPKDSITHDGMIYRNGALLALPDACAQAYISVGLAVPADADDAAALQKLESANARRREDILLKAKEASSI